MALVESVNMSNNTTSGDSPNASVMSVLDDSSRHPRIVFLALFMLTALVGNICLIIVIVQNKKYRRTVPNIILLNLCVVDLLDSFLNMPLVFGSLIATDWVYGDIMCRFNTFCMNIVIVETVLTLTALTIERLMAVKIVPSKYGSILSPSRTYVGLGYTWFHSFGFSLPLLAGAVPSTFRQPLHLCSMSDSSSLAFICLTSIICFVTPLIVMLVLYGVMFKAAYSERFEVRSKLAEQNYSEKNAGKPELWKEIDLAKFAGLLSFLWVIFEVPYIITTYIKQYQFSREFLANPSIGEVDYPWVVDVTFVWVRFAFSGILPILTFAWRREFWRSWKEVCRRSNSITDSVAFVKPQLHKVDKLTIPSARSKEREKIASPSALTFNVPVLFATESGIHVQTDPGDGSDAEEAGAEMPTSVRSSSELKFLKGRKLDVISALDFVADTSDYDSENETTDPYSLSQPVSARQLETNDLDKVGRSSSHPDIQERRASRSSNIQSFEAKLTPISYGTDSGLDLSGPSRSTGTLLLNSDALDGKTEIEVEKRTFVFPGSKDPGNLLSVDKSKNNGGTFTIDSGNEKQKTLNETYTHKNSPQEVIPVNTDLNPLTAKPPPHLEPLTETKNDFKQSKRKNGSKFEADKNSKSRPSTSSADKDAQSGGQKKTGKPGHKRQGTAESQKALLGSSSSAELQEMRSVLQEDEREKTQTEATLSGQAQGGSHAHPAKEESD